MLSEHLGRANGEGRIQEDRRCGHFAALHQVDEIDDQFLGPLDRKGWNEHGAFGGSSVAHLGGKRFRVAPRRVVAGRSVSP